MWVLVRNQGKNPCMLGRDLEMERAERSVTSEVLHALLSSFHFHVGQRSSWRAADSCSDGRKGHTAHELSPFLKQQQHT